MVQDRRKSGLLRLIIFSVYAGSSCGELLNAGISLLKQRCLEACPCVNVYSIEFLQESTSTALRTAPQQRLGKQVLERSKLG